MTTQRLVGADLAFRVDVEGEGRLTQGFREMVL